MELVQVSGLEKEQEMGPVSVLASAREGET